MAVTTFLGLMAQRWMSYELLSVDGGIGAWCIAAAILAGMGVATALIVGAPSYLLTRSLGLTGTRQAAAFGFLATLVTTIAHRSIAPFASTVVDHLVIPGLSLVFFGIVYASYYRARTIQPNTSMQGTALRAAADAERCRGRFAPATTGRQNREPQSGASDDGQSTIVLCYW
jgi:hypothetical protein